MTTVVLALGTIGLAVGCLVAIGFMLAVVRMVLPQDPPPLEDGESIASRLGKLYWE